METNQPRTTTHSLRIVGALTSAAAVALLGTGALAPVTAQAAGVATGYRVPASPVSPLADPAAVTTTSTGGEVATYRVRGIQLERI
ncbi:hypothetical protein [Knoellia sp. LjRoot47]|uniref:hypothetical protein n=1 Tax=Knoellia sp. LjRoot47 TaxID=3342330 RepID=UPI003ECC217D